MKYNRYGKTNKKVSVISMGSTRFNPSDLNDEKGILKCVDLVVEASEKGINYFDIASNYAKSQCDEIYRLAFAKMRKPFYVSSKTSIFQEKTGDDVLRKIDESLEALDVEKIDFFYMWSIMDWSHYLKVMKKGGPYEGAMIAKKRGLIDHIVFSNHASVEEAVRIVDDAVFEGITMSYNLMNYKVMDPLLWRALERQMGIMIMNPLAGGVIPQNLQLFSGICMDRKENVIDASLRFIASNKGITSIMSGISNSSELTSNIAALGEEDPFAEVRKKEIGLKIEQIDGFCTGCGYCRDRCPKLIPIPEYMQSFNQTLFTTGDRVYGRTDEELKKRILVMKKLKMDYKLNLESSENTCISCGKCEEVCTQHLPIISRLEELSMMIKKSGIAKEDQRAQLKKLIKDPNYKKVGFYTGGGYTASVIDQYFEFFGDADFEILIFDSSESRWEGKILDYTVYPPSDIIGSGVECLVISNYIYSEEIYENVRKYEDAGVKVLKLHDENHVPWVF